MGNKIITEKDFWKCSCGAVPAQFQSTQKTVKKKSGEKFITVRDTATSSWIDFGCTRLMLIYAIIAAAVVVIAAMTVATGGAALIALGALAGLAGAAWGAIVGSLLCGQVAAKARKWVGSKKNYIVQGVETITGDHQMTCPVGGTITFAPEIKSWSQAVSLGAANYIGHLMEGMMAGAAIGMGGAAISGGASAFASGGMRGVGQAALQFAKSAPVNVLRNIGATFGYAGAGASTTAVYSTIGTAIGLRSLTATQAGLQHYGETGQSGWGAAGKGAFGMETGMYHSVDNLTTFHNPKTGAFEWQGSWQDVAGLALLLSPVHKAPEELKGKEGEPVKDGEQPKDGETVKDLNAQKEEAPKKGEDGEAYEDTPQPKETPVSEPPENVYHMKSDQFVQGVVDNIDPQYFQKTNRYSDGFYIAQKGETAIAEVAYHGGDAAKAKIIRFNFDKSNLKILDLTDSQTANDWGLADAKKFEQEALKPENAGMNKYEKFQEIADKARAEKYDAIKFNSARGDGYNYVVYGDSKAFFGQILKPQMVMPASE